jgi:hypothetical protein
MIIYNVTIKITWAIHNDWLQWMQQTHIPQVLATGCFVKNVFAQLLDIEEDEGPTYTSQYYANTYQDYEQYIDKYSNVLKQDGIDKWGNQFIAFRTVMQVVN